MGAFSHVYTGPVNVSLFTACPVGGYSGPYWTAVDEGLPEEGTLVLVYNRNGWMGAAQWYPLKNYDGTPLGVCWAEDECSCSISDVTHWMPLPEPPKTDA